MSFSSFPCWSSFLLRRFPLPRTVLAVVAFIAAAPSVAAASVITTPVRSLRTQHGTVGYRSVGHGRPLVLIMGLAGSIDAWQPSFVDALARHHRVIVFDNEGVGLSTLQPGTLTITRMAEDTSALISAMHLRRPDVLGWSMGGMIAQALAVRHPGQVRRLILSATAPGDGHAVRPAASVVKVLTGGPGNLLGELFPADQQQKAARAYTTAITQYPGFYLPSTQIDNLQLGASTLWLTGQEPSGLHEHRLRVPTLIGDGVQDVLLPAINSRKLARLIPHAQIKLYADAGHAFLFQDGSSWVKLIDRFLTTSSRL